MRRTTYRPDPWRPAEWAVASCGVVSAAIMVAASSYDPLLLHPSLDPLQWPDLPLLPLVAVLLGVLPAWLAPRPERPPSAPSSRTGGGGVIRLEHVSVTYPDATFPVLRNVDLTLPEGELCLVVGRTGAGKSTLLGAVNGLVPHFTGGTLSGAGARRRPGHPHAPRRAISPTSSASSARTRSPASSPTPSRRSSPTAWSSSRCPADVMRKRVEETLDLLGLADLRYRALRDLSGGQQQRVAIGSVLTTHPRILVLDEPTSALDPTAAEEVLAAITRLVHDLGVTVLLAEHRLERVLQYADRVLFLPGDGTARTGLPVEMMTPDVPAPPVVELGRLAGWDPLPLSVRDARRQAAPLRDRLGISLPRSEAAPAGSCRASGQRNVVVRYGDVIAVREVDLELAPGRSAA